MAVPKRDWTQQPEARGEAQCCRLSTSQQIVGQLLKYCSLPKPGLGGSTSGLLHAYPESRPREAFDGSSISIFRGVMASLLDWDRLIDVGVFTLAP